MVVEYEKFKMEMETEFKNFQQKLETEITEIKNDLKLLKEAKVDRVDMELEISTLAEKLNALNPKSEELQTSENKVENDVQTTQDNPAANDINAEINQLLSETDEVSKTEESKGEDTIENAGSED